MKNIFVPFLILIALITISFRVEGINVNDHTFPESQGTTEHFLFFHGQKCGEVTAGEYIRREGQYINAYARSAVYMWASGLKGADGTVANIVEYRADGKVKGTGNTTFISDGTPPMTDQYTDPSHNRVVHSSDFVAYGGGTRTNVAYIKQAWMANEERTLYISGTGRAQRYIGWSDTPKNAPWYLDPWAWANGRALNAGENPQPKNIVSESNAGGEEDDNHDPGSSPVVSPMPTPTPTDGTPNCPDCTSACSSPCSCTNSGTCNGTVSYHACGQHETSVSGDHSYGTYTCGDATHVGYKCQESHDHKTYISACTSTDSNGNSCTNTGGYYECQPHTHSYPPTTVTCAHSNCSEQVSSRTDHRKPCSSGKHYYWPGCPNNTNSWSQNSTHEEKTCRYSDCGQTWRRCLTLPPDCTSPNRQRQKCWAQ